MIPYMAERRHPLNSQVLAIFFPSGTIPAMLNYSEFTDKYSPQYSRWSFLLYFVTNILFRPSFPHFQPLSPWHNLSNLLPSYYPYQQSQFQQPFFSSHSPNFPFVYPKPATEHYPQKFRNILNRLVTSRS